MTFDNSLVFLIGQLHFGAAVALVTVGLYHALLYVHTSRETETLFFALLSVIGGIYLARFLLIAELPRSITDAVLYILVLFTVTCIRSFLQRQESLLVTVFSILCTAVPVALVVAAAFYYPLQQLHTLTLSFLLPLLLYAGYMLIDSVAKRQSGAGTLLCGFLFWSATAGVDVAVIHYPQVRQRLPLGDMPQLHGFGFFVMWLLFWIVLGRVTVDRHKAYVTTTDTVVGQRTRELQTATVALNETMAKLHRAETACSLSARIATRLQQNYYPQKAPLCRPWQIGLVFQPAGEIAGNLYDFYTAGNELQGAALFDVSRHDAVGGLTAVLAKAIIADSFQKPLKLSSVMRKIHQQLTQEAARCASGVRGVLMRISANELECAIAGHTEIVLRVAADSNVRRIGGPRITGSVLALPDQPDQPMQFPTVKLNLKQDDVVVAYSAAVTGVANAQGQQFGFQGIRDSLRLAGGLTAQEIANRLLGDLHRFIGSGQPMADDLTVIVLRYMG